jgi:hypothetical protein
MKNGVQDIDRGYKATRARLQEMKGASVKVGFQDGETRTDEGEISSMAMVAAVNEFGTEDGRIPERSFMRSTFDEKRDQIARSLAGEAKAIIDGRKTVALSLGLIGQKHQDDVIRKIRSHPPPPNAESTIKAKESSGTLIDSGQMAQSVRYQVDIPKIARGKK